MSLLPLFGRYCYKTLKQLLEPISPLGKFMCIKMVVFFTFWQQTFFTILFWLPAGKDIQWCHPCCRLSDDGSAAERSYGLISICDRTPTSHTDSRDITAQRSTRVSSASSLIFASFLDQSFWQAGPCGSDPLMSKRARYLPSVPRSYLYMHAIDR